MFLIIKVNVLEELLLQARRIQKQNIERGYELTKNVGQCGCLTKKNCLLKLSAMARNNF